MDAITIPAFAKELAPLFGGFLALWGGYLSYLQFKVKVQTEARAQKWKELEFAKNELDAFFAKRSTKNCLNMIDYSRITIHFAKEESDSQETQKSPVDRDLLSQALRVHTDNDARGSTLRFSPEAIRIRKEFDEFFTDLSRFSFYVDTGLINRETIYPHFKYWIELLNGKRQSVLEEGNARIFTDFVQHFGYDGVEKMLTWGTEIHSPRYVVTPPSSSPRPRSTPDAAG